MVVYLCGFCIFLFPRPSAFSGESFLFAAFGEGECCAKIILRDRRSGSWADIDTFKVRGGRKGGGMSESAIMRLTE